MVAGRLRSRVQLTTDGHRPYLDAVEQPSARTSIRPCSRRFRERSEPQEAVQPRRMSLGCKVENVTGDPNPELLTARHLVAVGSRGALSTGQKIRLLRLVFSVGHQNMTIRDSKQLFGCLDNAYRATVDDSLPTLFPPNRSAVGFHIRSQSHIDFIASSHPHPSSTAFPRVVSWRRGARPRSGAPLLSGGD
jgi:hypothetical protein